MVPIPAELRSCQPGSAPGRLPQQYAKGSGTTVPLMQGHLACKIIEICEEIRKNLIRLLPQELTLVFSVRKLRLYLKGSGKI